MLNVVQINSADQGGGAETVARLHHEELLRLGHQSRLFVGRKLGSDEMVEQIRQPRGPIGLRRLARWIERRWGLQNLYSPGFRQLPSQIGDAPDIVHIHSLHGTEGYAELGMLPTLARRFPLVISLHDMWLLTGHCGHSLDCERWKIGCGHCPDLSIFPAIPVDGTHWNWRWKRFLIGGLPVHFIAPSEWLRQQVGESPILQRQPITVIPNPVDLRVFLPGDRQIARQKLQIGSAVPVVLLVANYLSSPFKGIDQAISAINSLGDVPFEVLIVGADAAQAASAIQRRSHVQSYLPPAQLADCYRAADVTLVPSRGEIFGLVAAESMACGTPVIAYRTGGLPEVIGSDQPGGVLVPRDDVVGLTQALDRCLNDDAWRETLGRQAARRAAQRFSPVAHSSACLTVYEQARQQHATSFRRSSGAST